MAGCSNNSKSTSLNAGSSEATPTTSAHMAGPPVEIHVTPETIAAKPKPWVLTTPQSAVRSYLDWTSYAYRIATSDAATPTMGPDEGVRVDSYVQYNAEKKQIIDQTLSSITFGKPSVGTTSTLVPTKESWSYRYVSIEDPSKVVGGPYTASYDSTYTLVKSKKGGVWQVYKVDALPQGTVK